MGNDTSDSNSDNYIYGFKGECARMTNIKLSLKDFHKSPCILCDGSDSKCRACGGTDLVYYVNLRTANKAFFLAGKRQGRRDVLRGSVRE